MRGFPPWMGSAQCAMGKLIHGPSNAAQMQGSQYLKGYEIYSLCRLLFLFCLNSYFIKPFITELFPNEIQTEPFIISLSPPNHLPGAEQVHLLFLLLTSFFISNLLITDAENKARLFLNIFPPSPQTS